MKFHCFGSFCDDLRVHFSFQISVGDAKICLLNTHLESTKDGANLRVQQLSFMLRHFKEINPDITILAGGDLNLRDKEVNFQYSAFLITLFY